jgi:hypothetical protein
MTFHICPQHLCDFARGIILHVNCCAKSRLFCATQNNRRWRHLLSAQEKSEDAAKYLCVCAHLLLTLPKCLSARQRGVDKRAGRINNGQIYGLLTRRSFGSQRTKRKSKIKTIIELIYGLTFEHTEPKTDWIMDSVSPLFSLLSLAAHREMMCNLGCAAEEWSVQ